jgi:hypothetical protein
MRDPEDSFLPIYDRDFAPRLEVRSAGFRAIFAALEESVPAAGFRIVETGSLRTPGNWQGDGQSTRLFDAFVCFHGGSVVTFDLDPAAALAVRQCCSALTTAVTGDSVAHLHALRRAGGAPIDCLYLDSLDLDPADPMRSALHHLKELTVAWPLLASGAIVAIDDNPQGDERMPFGKGLLVDDLLHHLGCELLHPGYQHVWRL